MTDVDPTDTRSADTIERAAAVGERIRARMRKLGWLNKKGEPSVAKLGKAVGLDRFQTVQYWIIGRETPSEQYSVDIAKALDMTLEELMGLPPPKSPPNWEAFLMSDRGRESTAAERAAMRPFPWPHPPSVDDWTRLLLTLRAQQPSS